MIETVGFFVFILDKNIVCKIMVQDLVSPAEAL